MKKAILPLFAVLVACISFAGTWIASPGKGSHAAAGGAGNEAVSDTFTGADLSSLSGNWTVGTGGFAIRSNTAAPSSSSFVENIAAYTGMTTDTANQYVKATLVNATATAPGSYPCLVFRYTNASSPMYAVFFWAQEDKVTWARKATALDPSYVTVGSTGGSGTFTVAAGDIYGITVDGTGTSTTVRIWKNPSTDTPTSASNWGGDTSPDITFTDDPASPVNTGTTVGIGGEMDDAVNGIRWDNFFGGDTP